MLCEREKTSRKVNRSEEGMSRALADLSCSTANRSAVASLCQREARRRRAGTACPVSSRLLTLKAGGGKKDVEGRQEREKAVAVGMAAQRSKRRRNGRPMMRPLPEPDASLSAILETTEQTADPTVHG